MWEKDSENWSLIDFMNKRLYHIEADNERVEVSEEIGGWEAIETSPVTLFSPGGVYGTHEGSIDWLLTLAKLDAFNQVDLDGLKRIDLAGRRLSFELVHPDLLDAYKMLQEILTTPRESLIGLSKDSVQPIKDNLQQLLNIFQEIHTFNPQNSGEAQNFRDEYRRISRDIIRLCDSVRGQLGPVVTYVKSKKVEQLEAQVKATVDNTVTDAVEKLNAETDGLQEQSNQAEQNEAKRQEDFNQLKSQLNEQLAKESVSEYGKIFEEQANKHKRAAFWWLVSTVGLSIGFGCVFVCYLMS